MNWSIEPLAAWRSQGALRALSRKRHFLEAREGMISQDLLDILRCPLSPSNTRLRGTDDHLECERCALRFKIKDGFPILVVEEADLPPGCESIGQLPCQREEKKCEPS